MTSKIVFDKFGKVARLSRDMIITEKLDGTNASIHIRPIDGAPEEGLDTRVDVITEKDTVACYMRAGGKNGWITWCVPHGDNYGFAEWVRNNAQDLAALGIGSHYGEWWGMGIQRKYGIGERRFSLCNVNRWDASFPTAKVKPVCCHTVPVLCHGIFDTDVVVEVMAALKERGSAAAPGFMNPEGVVVYHMAANVLFKKTFHRDEAGKGDE